MIVANVLEVPLRAWDCQTVYTCDDLEPSRNGSDSAKTVWSSPNADYIPGFERSPRSVCRALADGRYGIYDFTIHPQETTPWSWHNSVLYRPHKSNSSSQAIYWSTPARQQFTPIPGTLFTVPILGTIAPSEFNKLHHAREILEKNFHRFCGTHHRHEYIGFLKNLWTSSKDVLERLQHCPMSFRNVVMN